VQNIYLFGDCSREFVSTLVGDVKVEWYMPGEVIINERDAPTIFYILATGKVDIITTLSDGSEEVSAWQCS
jgi:CRP-like cAMP-binding protein